MFSRLQVDVTRLRASLDQGDHEPSQALCEAVKALLPIAARKDAEAILHNNIANDTKSSFVDRGLGRIVYPLKSYGVLKVHL